MLIPALMEVFFARSMPGDMKKYAEEICKSQNFTADQNGLYPSWCIGDKFYICPINKQ